MRYLFSNKTMTNAYHSQQKSMQSYLYMYIWSFSTIIEKKN